MFIFILLIKQLSRAERYAKKGIKKRLGATWCSTKMETNCLMVQDVSYWQYNSSPVLGCNLNVVVEIRFTQAFFDVNSRRSVISQLMIGLEKEADKNYPTKKNICAKQKSPDSLGAIIKEQKNI